MKKKSNLLVTVGALAFLIGSGIVLAALRSGDEAGAAARPVEPVSAEVAAPPSPVPLRAAAIEIPAGKQAVAVQLPFVEGGAGYVAVGDRVHVYGNVAPAAESGPVTKLVLRDVEVLDVSTEVAPRVTGATDRPTGSAVTYLLALTADEAERVIFLSANAELWLALAGKDAVPQPPTAGRSAGDVLQ